MCAQGVIFNILIKSYRSPPTQRPSFYVAGMRYKSLKSLFYTGGGVPLVETILALGSRGAQQPSTWVTMEMSVSVIGRHGSPLWERLAQARDRV